MNRVVISTEQAPRAIGPYSQGIGVGDLVFVSGQLGLAPDGTGLVSDDIGPQTEQALENIQAILEAAGLSLSHVVKTTLLLTNMADFKTVNEIYGKFFADAPPARAAYAVAALPLQARIEIEAIASKTL